MNYPCLLLLLGCCLLVKSSEVIDCTDSLLMRSSEEVANCSVSSDVATDIPVKVLIDEITANVESYIQTNSLMLFFNESCDNYASLEEESAVNTYSKLILALRSTVYCQSFIFLFKI